MALQQPGITWPRGCKFEYGYALASNFATYVIGEEDPGDVFTTLAERHFDDFTAYLDYLAVNPN